MLPPPQTGDTRVAALARLQSLMAAATPVQGGAPAVAVEQAAQAVGLALALDLPALQLQAGAWQCGHLRHLGQHTELLEVAKPLLIRSAQGLREGHSVLAPQHQELLRLVALSGSDCGEFDIALGAANELMRLTAQGHSAGDALNAAFALGACFERMGDSWQAVRVLTQALEVHGAAAPDTALLVTCNALCAFYLGMVHRMAGEDEVERQAMLRCARSAGERANAVLQRTANSGSETAVFGNLGEVMLHQGEVAASESLLRRAYATATALGLRAHGWRVRATMADWSLASGRAAEALSGARTLLREMGAMAPPQTAARAQHAAYRACRALRRPAQALQHFEAFEQLERRRATAQLKAQSHLLVTRVEMQREQHVLVQQAESARSDARQHRESSERDPLTGLGNRRHLARRVAELFPALQRDSRPLALAQIDVDHFKQINDQHGHAVGDRVLVTLAALLRENTRAGDVVTRIGGEEFLIILPGMALPQAADFCERLRWRVAAHPWPEVGGVGAITVSIGLVGAPPYDEAVLMLAADRALYRAKREGRNRLCQGQT